MGGCEELVKCPGSWRSLRPFFAPFAVKGVDLAQGPPKNLEPQRTQRKDAEDAEKCRVVEIRTLVIAFNQFSLDNARFH